MTMPPLSPLPGPTPCFAPQDAGHGAPKDPDFVTPEAVHEHLLEITRQAYLQDDEDMFVARLMLPQTIKTSEFTKTLTTLDDVRQVFRANQAKFLRLGVTDLVRVCISARFVDPDRVQATHVSYLMQGTRLLVEPYPNTGELVRKDGLWLISSSQYGSDDPAWVRFSAERNLPQTGNGPEPSPGGAPEQSDRKDET